MNSTTRLAQAVSAVCPVSMVRSDGTFDPVPTATAEQIAAANAVVSAFDWTETAHTQWLRVQERKRAMGETLASREPIPIAIRTILHALYSEINDLRELQNLPRKQSGEIINNLLTLLETSASEPINM